MAAGRRAPSPLGILVVATAAFVAALVTFGIFLPAAGVLGDAARDGAGTLPARLSVCGRTWERDPLGREQTRDEVFARTDAEPVVVDPASPSCPPGIVPGDRTVTTVHARTGPDRYVAYEAAGAP